MTTRRASVLALLTLAACALGYLLVLLFHTVDGGGVGPVPKTKTWVVPKERVSMRMEDYDSVDTRLEARRELELLRFFVWDHLPPLLQGVSKPCGELAELMSKALPVSAELTAGLRKLVEAKDCFVRAALDKSNRT